MNGSAAFLRAELSAHPPDIFVKRNRVRHRDCQRRGRHFSDVRGPILQVAQAANNARAQTGGVDSARA